MEQKILTGEVVRLIKHEILHDLNFDAVDVSIYTGTHAATCLNQGKNRSYDTAFLTSYYLNKSAIFVCKAHVPMDQSYILEEIHFIGYIIGEFKTDADDCFYKSCLYPFTFTSKRGDIRAFTITRDTRNTKKQNHPVLENIKIIKEFFVYFLENCKDSLMPAFTRIPSFFELIPFETDYCEGLETEEEISKIIDEEGKRVLKKFPKGFFNI